MMVAIIHFGIVFNLIHRPTMCHQRGNLYPIYIGYQDLFPKTDLCKIKRKVN